MRLVLLIISSLLLSVGVSNAQDVELFSVARNECVEGIPPLGSSLFRVDPDTAETEIIGPIGFGGVTGLAFLRGRILVGSSSGGVDPRTATLIRINPETGQGSIIGVIGNESVDGECGRAPDLTYEAATNTLFASGDVCDGGDSLQTVNPITGQGTVIGNFDGGIGSPGNGLAISDTGVLFHSGSGVLSNINRNTGEGTFIANLTLVGRVFVNALAFHPVTGELYGTTVDLSDPPTERSSALVKINTETGVTTVVGDLPNCSDGLIFFQQPEPIPTLSEWGLIAMAGVLGIIGLLALRRRKVTA